MFQPLKGNNGRYDVLAQAATCDSTIVSTPQRKQRPLRQPPTETPSPTATRFNPSKETTAVTTRSSRGILLRGHRFQPLKGNNGRYDSSYPQWEPAYTSIPFLSSLWVIHCTFV